MRARRPVAEVLGDPGTPARTSRKLEGAQEALRFAHLELSLPDNGSYRQYAELDRPYVVWNVFAAPEFSLELRTWCFPVAGCVAYRGYFREQRAPGTTPTASPPRGDDVYVGGAAAYSTLGFFRDPLLSSVVRLPDASHGRPDLPRAGAPAALRLRVTPSSTKASPPWSSRKARPAGSSP